MVSKTLAEHLHVTDADITTRKHLLGIDEHVEKTIADFQSCQHIILTDVVDSFYRRQVTEPLIAEIIGDRDTLIRLQRAMHGYLTQLFSGDYGIDYVNSRLRIGKVHAQIGVSPSLYISSMNLLEEILIEHMRDQGADDYLVQSVHRMMLFDLQLVFDTYIQGLVNSVEHHRDQVAAYAETLEAKVIERTREIERLAQTDEMTGLFNRREFFKRLDRELKLARRRAAPLALVFFDLDNLKAVNDRQGHLVGDQMLRRFTETLLATERETDLSFRYGGDEFCVVLPDSDLDGAQTFCARLVDALPEDISTSYGIAIAGPRDAVTADALVSHADTAMFEHKRSRKNGSKARA